MSKIQKTRKKRGLIIITIFLLIVLVLVIFLKPIVIGIYDFFEGEIKIYSESGYFELNLEILFYDVDNDLPIGLIPIPDEDISYTPLENYIPLSRRTSDYFEIAKKINDAIWEESFDEWKISTISAGWDCEHVDQGEEFIFFEFYKNTVENGEKTRLYTKIAFLPKLERILWRKEIHQPRLFSWHSVDFDHFVPPEEILSIAENDGGYLIRTSVANQCTIRVNLKEKNWNIYYRDVDSDSVSQLLFERWIRSTDGKIKK